MPGLGGTSSRGLGTALRSLFRLYPLLQPYRLQAMVALLLLFFMVAADLVIPRLTQRVIDQGGLANDLEVVILGATGAGKSTLIHLIPLFYDVTGGRTTLTALTCGI